MNNWIMTYSGIPVCPLDPKPSDILIEDIAHALGMTCRWAGHCKTFYSVAEHSVRVADVCASLGRMKGYTDQQILELRMLGLMHDATEAYVGDIPRPLKSQFKLDTPRGVETFREAEAHLYKAIEEALRLPKMTPEYNEIVHLADNILLSTEARDVASSGSLKHEKDVQEPLADVIEALAWRKARLLFLMTYANLEQTLGGGPIKGNQ